MLTKKKYEIQKWKIPLRAEDSEKPSGRHFQPFPKELPRKASRGLDVPLPSPSTPRTQQSQFWKL